MTKVDEDKQHIIETMNRDKDFADEIKQLSEVAIKKLAVILNDFANRKSEDDILKSYVLNQLPDAKDKKILNDLINEFDGNESSEVISMVNGAGQSYKTSISAYLLSVITVIAAGLLSKTNETAVKYDKAEQNGEIQHLTGKNGDLNGILTPKKAKELVVPIADVSDDENGSLETSNYQSTTQLIGSTYSKIVDKVKQEPTTSQFMAIITTASLLNVIVSKKDVANAGSKRVISSNINGDFDKYNSRVVRIYRTLSARIDSEFKRIVAIKYKIKEAIIVNELGACKHCMENIGRVYDYNSACDMVPQHYCCRCEVKLLIYKNGEEDDD